MRALCCAVRAVRVAQHALQLVGQEVQQHRRVLAPHPATTLLLELRLLFLLLRMIFSLLWMRLLHLLWLLLLPLLLLLLLLSLVWLMLRLQLTVLWQI